MDPGYEPVSLDGLCFPPSPQGRAAADHWKQRLRERSHSKSISPLPPQQLFTVPAAEADAKLHAAQEAAAALQAAEKAAKLQAAEKELKNGLNHSMKSIPAPKLLFVDVHGEMPHGSLIVWSRAPKS